MLKTFEISFALRITYRVNAVIYAIKQIPLVGRLVPASAYSSGGLKIFAGFLAVIWEIITAFVGKLLYFLIMIAGAAALLGFSDKPDPATFFHILVCLSIIGAFMNNPIFEASKDKHYALISLGMDAKEYTVTNYFYTLIKTAIGFLIFSPLFGVFMSAPTYICLLVPLYVVGVKMTYSAYALWIYEKRGKKSNAELFAIIPLLAAAYVLPLFGICLPIGASVIVMLVGILLGLLSVRKIITFAHYRPMCREHLLETSLNEKSAEQVQVDEKRKSIAADKNITSQKRGFEFMSELFVKRHRKILWSAVTKISVVILALTVLLCIGLCVIPNIREDINWLIMHSFPIMPFAMYILNRGTGFTQALFFNCDHSLLTYGFFKKPKNVLHLFAIRLREIVKINLLPSALLGISLDILLYLSGGCVKWLTYLLLFVTVNAFSIFFSVHYLTIYYLFQPYNAATEVKSATYQLISGVTYGVCYILMELEITSLWFGVMSVAFCVICCIVACVLVYKLAPKRFRIRN